jgi:histidine triad (HIT) family protein
VSRQQQGETCIFCAIERGDLPSTKVYEGKDVIAFRDVAAQAPVHVLVVPRKHIPSVDSLLHETKLLGQLLDVCVEVAQSEGLTEPGYRIVSNHGRDGAQTVDHLHFHVLGGRLLDGKLG